MIVSQELLQDLYSNNILLRLNSDGPSDDRYDWLSVGDRTVSRDGVFIEANSGLYGGKYVPSLGGQRSSGLCSIGSFSYTYSALHEDVKVGRYCSISNGVTILDSYHPMDILTTSVISFRPRNRLVSDFVDESVKEDYPFDVRMGKSYPEIGHDVWIGRDAVLCMGICIGTGSVVAANSVVTKDVPPYCVVAGNPARIVKRRFGEKLTEDLLATQWWEYSPDVLLKAGLDDLEGFSERLQEIDIERELIYRPKTVGIGRHRHKVRTMSLPERAI